MEIHKVESDGNHKKKKQLQDTSLTLKKRIKMRTKLRKHRVEAITTRKTLENRKKNAVKL